MVEDASDYGENKASMAGISVDNVMIVRDRFDPATKSRCALKVRDEMLLMAFGWQNERISPGKQPQEEEEEVWVFDALGKGIVPASG